MDYLADAVVLVHLAFFGFVAGGFVATLIGVASRTSWALNPWFRIAHFCAVLLVVFEDWLTLPCPLNVLEAQLREPASSTAAPGILEYLLHHTLSERALDVIYWLIASVLLVLMIIARPAFRRMRS